MMNRENQETARPRELRRPFADAYQPLIKAADTLNFPHVFDLDDALIMAQAMADRRAEGHADPDPNEIVVAPLGQLPYLILSYLGQMPPTELLTAFKMRSELILGYIADGSIDRLDATGDRIELVHSRMDLRMLRRRWLKTPEGETPLPNDALMNALMTWCAVVMQVIMEFITTGAPQPAEMN